MIKLFWANLKMIFRNRQALFWSLVFPLLFTCIFGAFFGKGSLGTGKIAIIDNSQTDVSKKIVEVLSSAEGFNTDTSLTLDSARDQLAKGGATAVVVIPDGFGEMSPDAPTSVTVIEDPANAQTNSVVIGFLNSVLTEFSFEVQNVKQIFTINEEKTNTNTLSYFDFVFVGLIGMALMNSAVQGLAVSLSKYREDKILKRIVSTPIKTWKFIAAEVLSQLVVNFIQVSLIIWISVQFFDAHIYGNIAIVYLLSLVGAILFQLMGFAVASLSKTTQAAEGMSTAITIPMMFLSGVFFPIDQLPAWLYSILQFLPLSPLLKIIRTVALEGVSPFDNMKNIYIVGAWIIFLAVISVTRFSLKDE